MGLFIKDNQGRDQLQSKVASDLEQRLKDRQQLEADEPEPQFTENSHQTRGAGVLIALLALVLLIVIVIWASQAGGAR